MIFIDTKAAFTAESNSFYLHNHFVLVFFCSLSFFFPPSFFLTPPSIFICFFTLFSFHSFFLKIKASKTFLYSLYSLSKNRTVTKIAINVLCSYCDLNQVSSRSLNTQVNEMHDSLIDIKRPSRELLNKIKG